MSVDITQKAAAFRALHGRPFVIANAWDAGSAKALAAMGFTALATSSSAAAGVLGRRDGEITRDESLANARAIVDAASVQFSQSVVFGSLRAHGLQHCQTSLSITNSQSL